MTQNEYCYWCSEPIQTPTKWENFCSKKCAEADAKDCEATEQDKWAMRYEL